MEFQHYTIRNVLDSVQKGSIRIPAFQRAYVWEMDRVAYLLDSIYKDYPFGSLLFWRTKQQLQGERNFGTFELPEPQADYPVDYVLDGQQRLTSIFTVFQTELPVSQNSDWQNIYFDMSSGRNPQDSAFVPIAEQAFDKTRYFPLNVMFDSVKYRVATQTLTTDQIVLIDTLQEKLKELSIPVQVLKTEDRSNVAIVFERINRMGMALDTLQLLSAWTWSEEFDLLDRFRELREELSDFGFEGVGDDTDLILSCVAGIFTGEPGPEKLLELNGADVRKDFSTVENGIRGAIDFLRIQLKVTSLKLVPYPSMLVPLAVFFAVPDGREIRYDAQILKRWFWRNCFNGRYSSQTRRTVVDDIEHMKELKAGKTSQIDYVVMQVKGEHFIKTTFRSGTAATKTFILLLANNGPKSLLSGNSIDLSKVLLRYNRSEFHHIYPKAFLRDEGHSDLVVNCLANFCFLNAAENKNIGRKRPSVYLPDLDDSGKRKETLGSAFLLEADFNDDFVEFVKARSDRLAAFATSLMQEAQTPQARPEKESFGPVKKISL